MAQRPSTEAYHGGSGSVGVLFVHGFTGSPASLRGWAEATAAAGYRVALPRLPGHGTRWQDLAVTSWRDWYACVDRELTDLAASCDKVFVASLSMGGALSLMLAERRPDDVAGLLLANPAITAISPLVPFAGVLKHVVKSIPGIVNDAKLDIDEGGYDRTPIAAVQSMYRLWGEVRPYLDLVQCPLLIFRSAVDHVVPPNSVETIKRQVSSTDITEHVLQNSYHVATMDNDAGFIVATGLDFIAAHSQDSAAR
jgi:carboxylesterase